MLTQITSVITIKIYNDVINYLNKVDILEAHIVVFLVKLKILDLLCPLHPTVLHKVSACIVLLPIQSWQG